MKINLKRLIVLIVVAIIACSIDAICKKYLNWNGFMFFAFGGLLGIQLKIIED